MATHTKRDSGTGELTSGERSALAIGAVTVLLLVAFISKILYRRQQKKQHTIEEAATDNTLVDKPQLHSDCIPKATAGELDAGMSHELMSGGLVDATNVPMSELEAGSRRISTVIELGEIKIASMNELEGQDSMAQGQSSSKPEQPKYELPG